MSISLEQFKQNTLGGSYGNPGTGTFKGQCVSYVRQYMEQVLNVPSKAIGNASDYYNSPYMAQYFDKVTDKQDGDIICWGNDAGNWTGPEGHIAIWYHGQLLNQNYGGSLKVTINPFFQPGYQGALRLKGRQGMTKEQILVIYKFASVGDTASQAHINAWLGKSLDQYLTMLNNDPSIQARQKQARKAFDNQSVKPTPLPKGLYEVIS